MRNRFVRWLKGVAPQSIGAYWGEGGVCLMLQDAEGFRRCVYQPLSVDSVESAMAVAIERLWSYGNAVRHDYSLAVAMGADDVFVRTLTVPAGLSDAQIEQIATIEAVANLPVPPEEICLDFIRDDAAIVPAVSSALPSDETIRLAFCRRERIDEILATAEAIPLSVRVVDRDLQALHDAVMALHATEAENHKINYPFALLLTELNPRFVICLDALSFETYPIKLPVNEPGNVFDALGPQIVNCLTRCRMVRGDDALALKHIICVGANLSELPERSAWLQDLNAGRVDNEPAISQLPMDDLRALVSADGLLPPDELLLIAAGMAGRQL